MSMVRSCAVGVLVLGAVWLCGPAARATAAAQTLRKGEVIPQVLTRADATQSYALYVPLAYTPERKWPVVYCFDPAGRGRVPVTRFKDAAEQYGYIIVGSNNARNGPGVTLTQIVNALWTDTHARFALDERQTYAAGFSGGARVAIGVAYANHGQVHGVMASSGGFPAQLTPARDVPFALFATTGTDDFNNPELQQLDRTCAALGLPHRLVEFAGGHDWPPAEVCAQALRWFELQAMRAGRRTPDVARVAAFHQQALAEARAAEAAARPYDAYLAYQALAADFKDLRAVSEYEQRARQLQDTKEVRQALKQQRDTTVRQAQLERELAARKARLRDPADRVAALGELRQVLADLRRAAGAAVATPERAVARRLLELFFVQNYEEASSALFNSDYAAAANAFALCAEVRPDDPDVPFQLARAYALKGDQKQSLAALETAFAKGFADCAALTRNEDFNALRPAAQFQRLVQNCPASTAPAAAPAQH